MHRYTDRVRTSTLAAVALGVALSACSSSTATTGQQPYAPGSTATTSVRAPATTPALPTHDPVWITVKYRSDPVNIADPRFFYLDGSSSSLVDVAFYDSADKYMIVSLNGTAYHYCGMPGNVWSGFTMASSLGSFYNSEIKGSFDCRSGAAPDY